MNRLEKFAAEHRKVFLEGRQYEHRCLETKFTDKGIREAGLALIRSFPSPRKPDDGNGDEDAFNRGYNQALQEIGDQIINFFQKPYKAK